MKTEMNELKLWILLVVGFVPTIVFSQTPEQLRELQEIEAYIQQKDAEIANLQQQTQQLKSDQKLKQQQIDSQKKENEKLKKDVARTMVEQRILNDVKADAQKLHEYNTRCLAAYKMLRDETSKLSPLDPYYRTYKHPLDAYAELEGMTRVRMFDFYVENRMLDAQDELNLIKRDSSKPILEALRLTTDSAKLKYNFPLTNSKYGVSDATMAQMIEARYQAVSGKYKTQLETLRNRCSNLTTDVDLSGSITQRKAEQERIGYSLASYFADNYNDFYIAEIEGVIKPSENMDIAIGMQEVFGNLDDMYLKAAAEYDYFKALDIIQSYEKLALAVMDSLQAGEINASIREQNAEQVRLRVSEARQFQVDTLEKQKPSWWLEQKYNKTLFNIKNGNISCDETCKIHLSEVPVLIEAAKMIEIKTEDPIFVYLGYQAMDNAL